MAVRIRSLLVSGPLLVPLSGGGTLRLSPGQVTDELPDVEVENNAKVDRLEAERLIDVERTGDHDEDDKPDGDAEPDPAGPKTPRRATRQR